MNQATPQPALPSARRRVTATLATVTVSATLTSAVPVFAPTITPAAAATAKACPTPDFRDVAQGSSFHDAITWLRCEGISGGYGGGAYGSHRDITRGETAQLLYRFSGKTHHPGTERDFSDVNPGGAGFTAISWMDAEGFTNGYAGGAFAPDDPITRGELSAFLYRMSEESDFEPSSTAPFTDLKTTSAFYRSTAWLRDTDLVAGYADGSFRPGQAITRGETAQFLYALESRVNGTPPVYEVPAPGHSGTVNATGGSGGTYRDAQDITYSNGTVSSQYHLYADHLNGAAPHGIIIFLHGDGADEYTDPEGTVIPAYRELARQHDLMLVVPRTPDRTGADTWWEGDASSQYAADLLEDLGKRYNLDLNQVYWTGYSGGADTIAEHMLNTHSAGWTGGAAVIVAGGGIYGQSQPDRPIPAAVKKNFPMHWVVGAEDTPADGGSSGDYDAVRATELGHAFYTEQGLETSRTVIPGLDHYTIAPHGPATLARILESR